MGLRSLAKNLATVPGRKSLILLTGGFPMSVEDMSELTSLINVCNKSNVAVYPIDARGLVAPGGARLFNECAGRGGGGRPGGGGAHGCRSAGKSLVFPAGLLRQAGGFRVRGPAWLGPRVGSSPGGGGGAPPSAAAAAVRGLQAHAHRLAPRRVAGEARATRAAAIRAGARPPEGLHPWQQALRAEATTGTRRWRRHAVQPQQSALQQPAESDAGRSFPSSRTAHDQPAVHVRAGGRHGRLCYCEH